MQQKLFLDKFNGETMMTIFVTHIPKLLCTSRIKFLFNKSMNRRNYTQTILSMEELLISHAILCD